MSEETPAAFECTYADWKLIKTRGVIQIVVEVPLHDADRAYKVLGGMPDLAKEKWLAVACLYPSVRLTEGPPNLTTGVALIEAARPLPPDVWSLPSDPEFRTFITFGSREASLNEAEQYIREHCGVQTRSEITEGSVAAKLLRNLRESFDSWKREQ